MRILMITTMAGPEAVWLPGSEHDVSPDIGKELVDGGYAQIIDNPLFLSNRKLTELEPELPVENKVRRKKK